MKIAAIITARNEGEEVRRTVDSLVESIERPETELLVVVVDDASTDGSCEWYGPALGRVVCYRHAAAQGVGKSRNHGYQKAAAWGADAITFHDAHMRFPAGGLEALAERAVARGTFVCSGSMGLSEPSTRNWCCDLFHNANDGIQPKWRFVGGRQLMEAYGAEREEDVPEWLPSACPMGAGYVIGAETAARLANATGDLWDDLAGKWGFSEQAMAVKCWLLGIDVEFSRSIVLRHWYRSNNPCPTAGKDSRRNAVFSLARLLDARTFNRRIRPFAEMWLGKEETAALVAQAGPSWPLREGERKPDQFFSDMCGRDAIRMFEMRPPMQVWMDARFGLEAIKHERRARVLQWRPNELTFELADECDITAVEIGRDPDVAKSGHRATNWRYLAPGLGVDLVVCHVDSDEYVNPAVLKGTEGGVQGSGTGLESAVHSDLCTPNSELAFDLVIIGGERQDECRAACLAAGIPESRIVMDPEKGARDIAGEWLKGERVYVGRRLAKLKPTIEHARDAAVEPCSQWEAMQRARELARKGDHSYAEVLCRWCLELRPRRILEWGPGESTALMHALLPDAEILTIEHQPAFAARARKRHGAYAQVEHVPLKDYGANDYPVWPLLDAGCAPFDLAFVDGRRRVECLVAATHCVSEGGAIVLHDADRPHYKPGIDALAALGWRQVEHGNHTAVFRLDKEAAC